MALSTRALAEADLVLERTFSTQRQKHAQLEPTAAVADVTEDGRLTVSSALQSPHRARANLASIFNLPNANVRVVTPLIGGAFGKSDALTAEPFVAAAALVCKRFVWSTRASRISSEPTRATRRSRM
jgi:CO/xanthine dehydrogenase Mo-binding subunit